MDNEPPHSPLAQEPSNRAILLSALAWLGVIFVFALIVLVAYVPNRASDPGSADAAQRKEIQRTVYATQEKNATTYGWVNEADGIVRIPVERAKELVVRELQAEQAAR